MNVLILVLLVFAFVCFVLAAIPMPSRINLVALGLAFWVLTVIVEWVHGGGIR